jgi:hypothetical protein
MPRRDDHPGLFGPEAAPAYCPDPEKVRARLHKILAEARAAQKLPWEPTTVSLYRTIFPQMTNWLPEDEGAQLRFQFEAELERLKAA